MPLADTTTFFTAPRTSLPFQKYTSSIRKTNERNADVVSVKGEFSESDAASEKEQASEQEQTPEKEGSFKTEDTSEVDAAFEKENLEVDAVILGKNHFDTSDTKEPNEVLEMFSPKTFWSVHSSDCPGANSGYYLPKAPSSDKVGLALEGLSLLAPTPTPKSDRWMPLAIRSLPEFIAEKLAQQPLELSTMQGFNKSFLINFLGGSDLSTGIYYPATVNAIMKSTTYYILNAPVDPFLPITPGEHGARLAVFFNEFDDDCGQYQNVPLFVAFEQDDATEARYFYMGNYSINRYSDRLDFDRIQELVPMAVKMHWARILTSPDRGHWLEAALKNHLWPRPEYDGPLPEMSSSVIAASDDSLDIDTRIGNLEVDTHEFLKSLAEWERDASIKVNLINAAGIMESFGKEDSALEPGLRFSWEYLECVGFDRNFYYMLATELKKLSASDMDSHVPI